MRCLLSSLLLTFAVATVDAAHLEELYRQVDEAIQHSPEYVAQYEQLTATLQADYGQATDPERRYGLAMQLFERYRSFCNDSAIAYLTRACELAVSLGRPDRAAHCQALAAFQCSTVGLYTEALATLSSIRKADLDTIGLAGYYKAWMHAYGELGYYTNIDTFRTDYYRRGDLYRDSLYRVIDHRSQDYLMTRAAELIGQQRWEEATDVSQQWLASVDEGSREYAVACYYRYLIAIGQQQRDDAKQWLTLSALGDIRHAVMDQAALLALAELLNGDGDFDRSYRYIRFTWDCNNRFNTRMRSWQISPILTVIESNYQNELQQNARVLRVAIAAVSLLALLLVGLLVFLHRRNRQLAEAKEQLSEANGQLSEANAQLSTLNAQLSTLNTQLSTANAELGEANRVKEEYIGRFMSLCSQYIDKLDDYRKTVYRMMKNRQMDDLFQMSRSTELKERELEELFANFDSVFLHLFPTFVADFNSLLQPDVQIQPRRDDRLTTDLRIFALIRLGIEDSSKIAEFLHYSVNTIYNYRARIRNGAIASRDRFEEQVRHLGA